MKMLKDLWYAWCKEVATMWSYDVDPLFGKIMAFMYVIVTCGALFCSALLVGFLVSCPIALLIACAVVAVPLLLIKLALKTTEKKDEEYTQSPLKRN